MKLRNFQFCLQLNDFFSSLINFEFQCQSRDKEEKETVKNTNWELAPFWAFIIDLEDEKKINK